MITISSDMNEVIFDGKWTHQKEWKRSSLNTLSYDDGMSIQLRTAHQDNFVYVLIDAVGDVNLDKGSDKAVVCFDTKNDKTNTPNEDDYCFVVTLQSSNPIENIFFTDTLVLQGSLQDGFKEIKIPEGFIGISVPSDQNDRYSPIPHSTFEFRIPTDTIGRSDVYGFYLGVYDAHTDTTYTWPQGIDLIGQEIPSPAIWGQIISPDKTLPEFELPFFALALSFAVPILILARKKAMLANF